ncbi:hypothetical protein Fmac_024405 [Flemingia macrophylla]|uniref:Uncharacterized protein n=1 Tax=Flemingia macrophylla TaxID=520843 RepID=A0ABD1LP98_9FABA
MGCFLSTPKDSGGNRRRPGSIGEVSAYVPGLRIPKPVDFAESLGDYLSKNIVERLSALRTRIVVMAGQEGPTITRTKRKSATQHGSHLQYKVQFVWVNQEDEAEETAMSNAWYEVLSVLHLMTMLSLSQANLLLLPRTSTDGQPKVTEANLGSLHTLDTHGKTHEGVDIQLGMAIDSTKATLAVKRRLACEMVKYWQQAQDNIMNLPLANGWGEKHRLFVKWKYIEAKSWCINPPLWGTMKYLCEKIPKDTSSKVRINRDLYSYERIMETAPTLPDFALALKPDDYQLPQVDPSWRTENVKGGQGGTTNHLNG